MKNMSVPERLAKNRFLLDEEESHIEIDQELCRSTGTGARIIAVFSFYERPGVLFSEEERIGFYGRAA